MGLKREVFNSIVAKRRFFALALTTLFMAGLCGGNVFAEAVITNGVFTDDATNIRWEWELSNDTENTEEPQKVTIKFYDKPENLTTVTVPSLSTVLGKVPGANSTLNTYYLSNANLNSQNEKYPDLTRREATADTTKLDMSSTSKIQILGVKPIINPSVETELVFGPNIVIGDGTASKMISAMLCGRMYYNSRTDKYSCYDTHTKTFPIPGIANMTDEELASYTPSYNDTGCLKFTDNSITSLNYNPSKCYVRSVGLTSGIAGAFSGYKLKLTNFDERNFNYIGWEAFAYTEISGQTMTITGDAFAGGNIFKGSNIKKATIETDTIGAGIFRDCDQLIEVNYADSVTKVTDDAFAGTSLTTFDFSTTNIKTIGPRAFDGAKLTSVKLDGVNRIEYMAFANNYISELTFPKSINYLQAMLLSGNKGLKKLTVNYDTLTSGTTLSMFVTLDNVYSGSENPSDSVEEIIVNAPYASDEEVSPTHIAYNQYKWHYDAYTQEYLPNCPETPSAGYCNHNSAASNDWGMSEYAAYDYRYYAGINDGSYKGSASDFENDYANVDAKKNIIAPGYFFNMRGIKKVTIGDGYEFIGSSAFTDFGNNGGISGTGIYYGNGNPDSGLELNLPDSLRGIGNFAFDRKFMDVVDITIPRNIEFIGIYAFYDTYFYDKDVDFPNLVALGDHAFERTKAKNLHFYDKLQYMGAQPFSSCAYINDITFDLDVFSPDIYIAWALPHRHGGSWYDGQFHLTTEFGPRYPGELSTSKAQQYGIKIQTDNIDNYWPLKFGKITFTEKNVSQLPNGYNNCYYGRKGFGYNYNEGQGGVQILDQVCPGGAYGTDIYNTFFGHINAEKVDISGTAWKVLSPRMFVHTHIGEVKLPKNLEVIPGDTFSDSYIDEELVLPDTLKVIGDAAFNFGEGQWNAQQWDSATQSYITNYDWISKHTIKITKLPKSLEYIGNDAFWGDYGLTADLQVTNLWNVGYKAFWGTNLRDVYLPPSIKALHGSAFANIPTLRNITIDFDYGALDPNYMKPWDPEDFPQSARDYAGANLFHYITMSCSASGMADYKSYPVTGFYSMFNHSVMSDDHDPNNYQIITAYGQKKSHTHFGKVTFTENAKTDITKYYGSYNGIGYFAGLEFDELDMSAAGFKAITPLPFAFEDTKIGTLKLPEGLEKIAVGMFENAEITEPFALPETLKEIGVYAFQWAKGTITNMLPDSVELIQPSAFYGADLTDNLVVPGSVQLVGSSSFNAGDRDVHYDTVKFEANVTNSTAHGQLIHQMFWNADIDKLRVDSSMLAGIDQGRGDAPGNQEFWNMSIKEATITNLPRITRGAFEKCTKLEKVDLSKDANLRRIGDEAFMDATSLHIIDFSPAIKDEYVEIGQYAFKNTAFESIGKAGKDININAAKFNAFDGLAFAEMPNLKTVDVPNSFSNGTIPAATFLNDTELEEASVDYKIKLMDNAAFGNDNKLKRIFIWGNTTVVDENLPGYIAPATGGMGSVTGLEGIESGPTIPEDTDIYAYSSWNAEPYAGSESRDEFDGVFYPLDEVLYITTNKTHVKVNDNETDFDKSGMIVYGLRRDGVVLESDSWGDFNNNVYRRSEKDLNFAKMIPAVMEDPAFATVWDTPVPVNELSYENENFKDIDFELVDDEDGVAGVKRINIIYTDAYTGGEPDTDVLPIGDNIPVLPRTVDDIVKAVSVFGILALVGAATLVVSRRAFHRR